MNNALAPAMDRRQVDAISALGLAHLGDAVYELMVRTWLCTHGLSTVQALHRDAVALAAAPAQAAFVSTLLPLLTPEEEALYRRGRNTQLHGIPKRATPGEYARATGLEALFGALYLLGRQERLTQLFEAGMEAHRGI